MTATATKRKSANGAAAKAAKDERIAISAKQMKGLPELDIQTFTVRVEGLSPLICHNFGQKQREQIQAKQQKKAQGPREKRDPRAEYLASFYMVKGTPERKGCVYGFPAAAFRDAMSTAAGRFIDKMTGPYLRGLLHVLGHDGTLKSKLVALIDHAEPRMVEDTVRLGGPGQPLDLRYRPYFIEWAAELKIMYNAAAIEIPQVLNILRISGFSIGVGDWRVEKGGSCGMYAPA